MFLRNGKISSKSLSSFEDFESAAKEVTENPERCKNFVTEGLDEYIASLSTNREWANNTLIQATANVLCISIKIIKDSERIPSYTVIPCEVQSNTRHQHVDLQNLQSSFEFNIIHFQIVIIFYLKCFQHPNQL